MRCKAGHSHCVDCILTRVERVLHKKDLGVVNSGLECFALSGTKCLEILSLDVLKGVMPENLHNELSDQGVFRDYAVETWDKRILTKVVRCPTCQKGFGVGVRATIIQPDPGPKHFCKTTCIRCKQIWKRRHKCKIPTAEGQAGAEKVEKGAMVGRKTEARRRVHKSSSKGEEESGGVGAGPNKSSDLRTEEDEMRLQREEALTAAVLSSCPECGVPVDKNNGCNKVFCGSCRVSFCFLCKSVIRRGEGYTHFCVHGSEGTLERCLECGKCKMSNTNKKRKEESEQRLRNCSKRPTEHKIRLMSHSPSRIDADRPSVHEVMCSTKIYLRYCKLALWTLLL